MIVTALVQPCQHEFIFLHSQYYFNLSYYVTAFDSFFDFHAFVLSNKVKFTSLPLIGIYFSP